MIPVLRDLNEFLAKDYPNTLFVKDFIELNQKFISQGERIKSIEGDEIPEDLLDMVIEIGEMEDLVKLTIDREEAAKGLLILVGVMKVRNLRSQ